MKIIGVVANLQKPNAAEALKRLARKGKELGLRLVAPDDVAAIIGPGAEPDLANLIDQIDVLIALGGDGTMLRAVRELKGLDKPVIGVNLGSLGYMTSVTQENLERALECFIKGDFTYTERSIAESVIVRNGHQMAPTRALNDIVVSTLSQRVINLTMSIDNEPVGDFVCDGLIVSTPTGSTGHSLSAGGPVLLPTARSLVVTLICPHTLSTRPLVIPDESTIRIKVDKSSEAKLTTDGQIGTPLVPDDCLEVRRSRQGVRFIHLPDYSYFAVLRQKLHWRGSIV